jgi:chromosome segregation ATPase
MAKGAMVQFPEDVGEGGRWMTYSELARIRGIGRESAVKLVQRERWRKLAGNDRDRTVRVLVPLEWLKPARQELQGTLPEAIGEELPEGIPEVSPQISALQIAVEALKGENSVLRDQLERERGRADRAEVEVGRQTERVARTEEQRDQAVADLHAERSRAERAEASRDGERGRTDALRDRLDAAEAELRQARQAAEQVRRHAREAEDATAALRQAEDERKARGRWARLRAAWRGE